MVVRWFYPLGDLVVSKEMGLSVKAMWRNRLSYADLVCQRVESSKGVTSASRD